MTGGDGDGGKDTSAANVGAGSGSQRTLLGRGMDFVAGGGVIGAAVRGLANAVENVTGDTGARTRGSTRPEPRPSIMQRGGELVATRDLPRFGILAGESAAIPEYRGLSVRGLLSTERGNVMRNIRGAERYARLEAERTRNDRGGGDEPTPQLASAAPEPVSPQAAAPAPDTGVMSEEEQQAQINAAGETAVERARRLGLSSTIATSPSGLAGGTNLRRRRSLMRLTA